MTAQQTQPQKPTKSYPLFAAQPWWTLRRKAQQSPPKQIDATYLITVLGISEKTAGNLLPPLRRLGLIDESGQPTALFHDWRVDDTYGEACKTMRELTYPEDLLTAVPGPRPDMNQVTRWFTRTTKTGEGSSKQMAALYTLLCEADLSKAPSTSGGGGEPHRRRAGNGSGIATRAATAPAPPSAAGPHSQAPHDATPSLHIDVQIHIASDAAPEQIDQIFASMAKHLYQH